MEDPFSAELVQAESKPHTDVDIECVYMTSTAKDVLKLIKTLRIWDVDQHSDS